MTDDHQMSALGLNCSLLLRSQRWRLSLRAPPCELLCVYLQVFLLLGQSAVKHSCKSLN